MSFIKKMMVLAGFLVLATITWGKTYYIPHIHTANDSWETNLIADNLGKCESRGFYLTLYAADGSVLLDRQQYDVQAGQSKVISLRPLGGVAGEVECGSESMRFRLGYVAKASSGGGTAEFQLPDRLSDQIVFSTSNYYDQLTWGGFAVFNGSDSDLTVTVEILTTSGKDVPPQLNIPAKTKVVNYFDSQFGVQLSSITSVIFTTDSPALTGITISGKDNEKLLFTGTGTVGEGWKLENHESTSWVRGVAQAGDTALAFCRIYKNYALSTEMKGINARDGLPLFTESASYVNLYPMGMVSNFNYSFAFAYGMDTSDSAHSYYFVARVNPEDGTLLWKTNLAEGQNPTYSGDDGFSNRICVATNGSTTVQAIMRDKDSYMAKALLNVETGVIIAASQTTADILPTALFFDSESGMYYSIYSQFDSATSAYSKVYFYKNSGSSIAGGGSVADLSTIIPDGCKHHVLVYGGAIYNGTVRLMYNASVGAPDPHAMISSIAELPSQFISGSVPVLNFNPGSASTFVTNLTGLLGDRVTVVRDGTNDALAIMSEVTTSNYRTYIFSYSEAVRTLPISVQSIMDHYGSTFLLGFWKEKPYSRNQTSKGISQRKLIYPGPETCIQEVSLVDLMNEFYK